MKREITITLNYNLTIGKVNLNEIVYQLKELRVLQASVKPGDSVNLGDQLVVIG